MSDYPVFETKFLDIIAFLAGLKTNKFNFYRKLFIYNLIISFTK